MISPSSRGAGYCLAIIGGVLWAIGGALGQLLFRDNAITATWLVPIRLILAGILFLLIARVMGKPVLRIWKEPKHYPRLILYALFGVGASQFGFYGCIQYANVAFSTVLCYICPVFLLIATMFRQKRGPRLYELTSVILVVLGVFACATHFDITKLIVPPIALFFGLLCGLTAAVNTQLPLPLMAEYELFPTLGWGMLLGGSAMALLFRSWQIRPLVNGELIGFMAFIIVGATVAAFACYMRGVQLVGSVAGSVLSSVEPLAAVVISIVFLKVAFTWADFLGFLMILLTIPIIALGQQREQRALQRALREQETVS